MKAKRILGYTLLALFVLVLLWVLLPSQRVHMPVEGATSGDYNPQSFWFYPWGTDRHHIGVDIFAPEGRNIHPACAGIVLRAGVSSGLGGKVVYILGTGGRVYYYAHLSEIFTCPGAFITRNDIIGLVGRTGNASRPGCPPHLHFSIFTIVPQWHDINETEASRNAYDHFMLWWLVDPIAEMQKAE